MVVVIVVDVIVVVVEVLVVVLCVDVVTGYATAEKLPCR